MSKAKKAGIIAFGNQRAINRKTPIVLITSGTMGTTCTKKGIIALAGTTAGMASGNVYLTINTAGTGTKINA